MKKIKYFLLTTFALISVFFFVRTSFAQNEFSVDATVTYSVQETGKTIVTHDIVLENNLSSLYATVYTLGFENIGAEDVTAKDTEGKPIPVEVNKDGVKTTIKVNFSDAVVGKGAQRHFSVSYVNSDFAVRTGEIWEVSIPRLDEANSFRNYKTVLKIPASFGLEAYISPKPISSNTSEDGKTYIFDVKSFAETGISAGFGQFQVFNYSLSYHLENPLGKSAQTQIAIPPDTAFQKVYLQNINPAPTNVVVDGDGNWLAVYNLSPRQRVDVVVSGYVQIFASYRSFPKPSNTVISNNLKETEYWQVNDPKIKALAQELRTPRAIFDYVSKTLKYDFSRVQPNVQRMGAVSSMLNPTQAICMEFTDLFIAIARAAGIPAREVNGYAYTENPELQPLSLVADVLHAWPEYYDEALGVWIPVDPTWASTSGGVDYFDKLDLRHFAFVQHGESPVLPYPPGSYKLGPNPQKDVYVSFGKLPTDRITTPKVEVTSLRSIPFLNSIYSVKVENPGPSALYAIYPTVFFDAKEQSREYVEVLPPFSNYTFSINVPFSLLGKKTPSIIEVRVIGTSTSVTTNKTQVIVNSLLAISAFLILIILLFLIALKKISFSKLFATIVSVKSKLYGKITGKFKKDKNSTKDLP